jgi:hypothetical protein
MNGELQRILGASPALREPAVRVLTFHHRTLSGSSRMKFAAKIIQKYGFDATLFPEVYDHLAAGKIKWMVSEGHWFLLRDFVNDHPKNRRLWNAFPLHKYSNDLPVDLVAHFVHDPQMELPAALHIQEAHVLPLLTMANFMPDAGAGAVTFVDSHAGVLEACDVLMEAGTIGLDCEWKAQGVFQDAHVGVAILQIGHQKGAYILDVIELYDTSAQCCRAATAATATSTHALHNERHPAAVETLEEAASAGGGDVDDDAAATTRSSSCSCHRLAEVNKFVMHFSVVNLLRNYLCESVFLNLMW